ncbi:MAG: hypothetical protein VKL60_15050 [Sphaerospermopsis sp.]|nr:hypothetical protein [Sphaerospermopsis sp.]
MKTKVRFKILKPEVISTRYFIVIGNWKEVKPWFEKHDFPTDWVNGYEEIVGGGCAKAKSSNAIVIWFTTDILNKKKRTRLINWITHECCHATWYTEKLIGDWFSSEIQEPQCYLLGWLVEECYKFLTGEKKENQ